MTRDDDLERVLARARPDAEGGPCLDAETLAAYAEGRLPNEGLAVVEEHLAACGDCRDVVALLAPQAADRHEAVASAGPGTRPIDPEMATRRARPRWVVPTAIAAALLLGIGAWLVLKDGDPTRPEDPDALLVAAARGLASARPDLFEGFTPLDRVTLASAVPEVLRGGLTPHAPRETVLAGRPTFRWSRLGKVDEYTLTVRGADGILLFSDKVQGTESPLPSKVASLPAGSAWQWEVAAKRATGPVSGSLGFRVATEVEAARTAEVEQVLRARAPPGKADLLLAHWAARAGFLDLAERAARAHAAAQPGDALGGATLRYVRARLGYAAEPE